MMLALMYGFKPRDITEKFARVPPEKISSSDKSWLCANKRLSERISTPGTGT